jgi:hypothetical protein
LNILPFPPQLLDGGKQVYFGQPLHEVEKLFDTPAIDNPLPVARKGTDKKIKASRLSLEFDSGRLRSIEFARGYQFDNPPKPYAQEWKNFDVILDKRVGGRMPREEFIAYLASWEMRARALGADKVAIPDLKEDQFRFSFETDKFSDMFHLSMGPSRRAGGGGIWTDGWTAFFAMKSDVVSDFEPYGELKSLCAFCDEFNTVARRKE